MNTYHGDTEARRKIGLLSETTMEKHALRTSVTQWWTLRNRSIIRIAIAAVALSLTFYGILRWMYPSTRWASVKGSLADTRIVSEHWSESKGSPPLLWRAEYKVAYSVAGHEYTVWSDSGIRGEDEDEIRLALSGRHASSCRVQYDVDKPDRSVAECH